MPAKLACLLQMTSECLLCILFFLVYHNQNYSMLIFLFSPEEMEGITGVQKTTASGVEKAK